MYDKGEIEQMVSDVTKALSIGLQDGTAKIVIPENSKVPIEEEVMLCNPVEASELVVSLYQGNSGIVANNSYIGTLKYDYGKLQPPKRGTVFVTVTVTLSGIVKLSCKELMKPAVVKELVVD